MNKEALETLSGITGGATLREKIPQALFGTYEQARRKGWKLEVIETESEDPENPFGDRSFRGKISIRFRKFGHNDNGSDDCVEELLQLKSSNPSSQKWLDSDDPNDRFTDRYFYDFDEKALSINTEQAIRRMRYIEASGNPNKEVWSITPEQLRKHYPEFSNAKILIEGWAKAFDKSKVGDSEELSRAEIDRVESVATAINSAFISAKNEDSQPIIVSAGNSAGIQKLTTKQLEEAGCQLLFSLPQAKSPDKYIEPSHTLVLQAPPKDGKSSSWGDELVGKTGIASTEFGVRTVIIVGGGENLKEQLPIYLDNVLKAQESGKMYVIVAVQGVGGLSSQEKLFEALSKLSNEPKYASLNLDSLDSRFPPTWLQLLDSENGKALQNEVDTLIMRTFWSDQF